MLFAIKKLQLDIKHKQDIKKKPKFLKLFRNEINSVKNLIMSMNSDLENVAYVFCFTNIAADRNKLLKVADYK
jgi:hypothetical protein